MTSINKKAILKAAGFSLLPACYLSKFRISITRRVISSRSFTSSSIAEAVFLRLLFFCSSLMFFIHRNLLLIFIIYINIFYLSRGFYFISTRQESLSSQLLRIRRLSCRRAVRLFRFLLRPVLLNPLQTAWSL